MTDAQNSHEMPVKHTTTEHNLKHGPQMQLEITFVQKPHCVQDYIKAGTGELSYNKKKTLKLFY